MCLKDTGTPPGMVTLRSPSMRDWLYPSHELVALPYRNAGCTPLSLLGMGCPVPPGQHSPWQPGQQAHGEVGGKTHPK